jgi:hypothetical protein
MANRVVRKTAILLKIETVYGTDSTPTGAANALLVSNLSVTPLVANNVNRDLIRAYFGGSEQLVGPGYVEMGFDLELQASGTLGTAPAWGPALRACGWAEAITASTRVEYTPITDSLESATIYWHDDGVLHKGLGARGIWEIAAGVGERPVIRCRFIALDGGISATANATPTLTAWKKPQVITDTNTADVLLGGSYSAGAVTGGTAYPSQGLSLSSGNAVNFTPLVGGETVELSARDISGHINFDLTAAQEVSFMADVKANNTQTISMLHGTTSGLKILLFGAAAQFINPTKQEVNGKRLVGYDLRLVPVSGNDELRIVAI